MVCKSFPSPPGPLAIRSPFFVRVTWNYGPGATLHDVNRQTLTEAARAVVKFLDDSRRDGWDHAQYIRTLEAGNHRAGSRREISLADLYLIAKRPRQTTIAEFAEVA
ncbi:MAG: hypothetical protein WC277_07000 [Bacilli bacterium]